MGCELDYGDDFEKCQCLIEEARRLIYFLRTFFEIPSEYVSEESIIREFIGGSAFRMEGDK